MANSLLANCEPFTSGAQEGGWTRSRCEPHPLSVKNLGRGAVVHTTQLPHFNDLSKSSPGMVCHWDIQGELKRRSKTTNLHNPFPQSFSFDKEVTRR